MRPDFDLIALLRVLLWMAVPLLLIAALFFGI